MDNFTLKNPPNLVHQMCRETTERKLAQHLCRQRLHPPHAGASGNVSLALPPSQGKRRARQRALTRADSPCLCRAASNVPALPPCVGAFPLHTPTGTVNASGVAELQLPLRAQQSARQPTGRNQVTQPAPMGDSSSSPSFCSVKWKLGLPGLTPSLQVFVQSLRPSGPRVKSADIREDAWPKLGCQVMGAGG